MGISKQPKPIEEVTDDGRPLLVTLAVSPGQLAYTAVSTGSQWDVITVEAWHIDAAAGHTFSFAFVDTGGTVVATGARLIPALSGPVVIGSNWRLRNGLQLWVWGDLANTFYVKVEQDQLATQ